jgi:hypothetical protein
VPKSISVGCCAEVEEVKTTVKKPNYNKYIFGKHDEIPINCSELFRGEVP